MAEKQSFDNCTNSNSLSIEQTQVLQEYEKGKNIKNGSWSSCKLQ